MPKTVFSKTSDVAREWAKGELAYARTGSNTSMRNGVLMSYGMPIAAMVRNLDVASIALISSGQWSNGTSKVQNEAAEAARDEGLAVFRVPVLGAAPADVAANLEHYKARIFETLEKLERGRVTSADSYRSQAAAILATAHNYARQFGGEWPQGIIVNVKHPKEEG